MAARPLTGCRQRGCPALVPSGTGYCSDHAQHHARQYNVRRREHPIDGPRERFYSTSRWRQARAYHLRQNPLCAACGGLGTVVDHIVPRRDGGADLAASNLQTLCQPCHSSKSATERGGRNSSDS